MLALGIEGSQEVDRSKNLGTVVVTALQNSVGQAKHLPWEIVAAQGTMAGGGKVLVRKQRVPEAVGQRRRDPETVGRRRRGHEMVERW